MVFILVVEQEVKYADIAMVGEAQVADAPGLALLQQEFEQAVVEESGFEVIHATAAYTVEQVVIDVIHLQFAE